MGKHSRDIQETETAPQPGEPLREIAQLGKLDLHFLLNFIALRHPDAYAEARSAQEELAARNAAYQSQHGQAVTVSKDSVWLAYANAIRTAESRVTVHEAMTGDDLITLVTSAPSSEEALDVARSAPAQARYGAAGTLRIDTAGHSVPWINRAIVTGARA